MSHAELPRQDVHTTLSYLARDPVYEKDRAYGADFPVNHIPGAKASNHTFDVQPVTIHDVRPLIDDFHLDIHGFCYLKAQTSLTAEDALANATSIQSSYFSEIEVILRNNFPYYSRFECMDLIVRKRDPEFPHNAGALVTHEQPAGIPHCDFSVTGAFLQMERAFPGQKEYYLTKNFDLINVWRPLKGPNDDWPLALCDARTVDPTDDICVNDALHLDCVGENWLLHGNQAHRWYYMSAQDVDDLIVFRNTDSNGKGARAFHAAFENSDAKGEPRQSVEVRVVAFR